MKRLFVCFLWFVLGGCTDVAGSSIEQRPSALVYCGYDNPDPACEEYWAYEPTITPDPNNPPCQLYTWSANGVTYIRIIC